MICSNKQKMSIMVEKCTVLIGFILYIIMELVNITVLNKVMINAQITFRLLSFGLIGWLFIFVLSDDFVMKETFLKFGERINLIVSILLVLWDDN